MRRFRNYNALMAEHVLDVRNLRAEYPSADGAITAVDDLSFSISKGECLALVGETGSGKSTVALSILRLGKALVSGEILLDGENILSLSEREMQRIRGRKISAIFQDSMSGLNPVITIGHQMAAVIRLGNKEARRQEVKEKCLSFLSSVGLDDVNRVYSSYPHELSGGMRQRVMIAMALSAGSQSLLVADEPTTALDATVQKGVLALLRDLIDEKGMSMLLISHDLGTVAAVADRVLVLYGGVAMEEGDISLFLASSLHPYSKALLKAAREDLFSLPVSEETVPGCRFAPRCDEAEERCFLSCPPIYNAGGRKVRCWKYGACDGCGSFCQ